MTLAARLSLRDALTIYPPRIYVATTLPRSLLQVAFLAYLGYYASGTAGREFAFVGACAQVIVLSTVVRGPDVLLDDRVQGTLHRLRLGVVPLPALIAVRWWVYVLEGTLEALAAVLVVGPALGEAAAVPRLLAAAPLFLLVAATTSALGFAVAAFSLTQRADVMITNLVSYATMLACGVVAPLSALGGLGAELAHGLPLTNGLLAIRALVDGGPWAEHAALEAAVGLGWLLVGIALLQLQLRRARILGRDEQL